MPSLVKLNATPSVWEEDSFLEKKIWKDSIYIYLCSITEFLRISEQLLDDGEEADAEVDFIVSDSISYVDVRVHKAGCEQRVLDGILEFSIFWFLVFIAHFFV